MSKLYFAHIKDHESNTEFGAVYDGKVGMSKQFKHDTKGPHIEIVKTIVFSVVGKTFKEKKEYLRNLAIEFQREFSECGYMFESDLAVIQWWFSMEAKTYGLANEFRENGII